LKKYKDDGVEIPHYLLVIDDDTYIDMDALTNILYKDFHYNTPQLVAGCEIYGWIGAGMNFPYGGFGTFLSQASIQRLLHPIDCSSTTNATNGVAKDSFSRYACSRLQQNTMGEKEFFTDGMSIIDLMHEYSANQPFTNVRNWTVGFCFHSDLVLAYFFNMYHLAVPDSKLEAKFQDTPDLRKKYKFVPLTNPLGPRRQGECGNERELCQVNSTVCHYIQPKQMDDLFFAKTQQTLLFHDTR
jgi:hypothetical protein